MAHYVFLISCDSAGIVYKRKGDIAGKLCFFNQFHV